MPLPGPLHKATYAGAQVLACDFLVLPGAEPSLAVLTLMPQQAIPKIGNLVLSDGNHTITYLDCAIDDHRMEVVRDSRRAAIWYVGVMDRRWKWKYQYISGVYNRRLANGEFDILYTDDGSPYENPSPQIKTFKELCKLLLEKMEETTFDVEDLPEDIYPYVDWDFANPAKELEKLCADYGRMIVLGQDNVTHIVERGGLGTIDGANATNPDHAYTRGVRPEKLKLVGGKTVVEAAYYLLPVGYEQDMTVKPIDALSYVPLQGWNGLDKFNLQWIEEGNTRSMAYASVYRKYRPYALVDIHGAVGTRWVGVEGTNNYTEMVNLDQMLPLLDTLCDPVVWTNVSPQAPNTRDRHKRAHKPFVKWGQLTPYSLSQGRINALDYTAFFVPDCEVDTGTGTVTFPLPITGADYRSLTVMCAHHVKHPTTGQYMRFTKTVDVPNGTHGTQIIHDETMVRTVIYRYTPDQYARGPQVEIVTNEDELQERADIILTEALRQYTENEQETELVGFMPILPESHIKHIHYQMRFNDAAFTTVRYTVAAVEEKEEE